MKFLSINCYSLFTCGHLLLLLLSKKLILFTCFFIYIVIDWLLKLLFFDGFFLESLVFVILSCCSESFASELTINMPFEVFLIGSACPHLFVKFLSSVTKLARLCLCKVERFRNDSDTKFDTYFRRRGRERCRHFSTVCDTPSHASSSPREFPRRDRTWKPVPLFFCNLSNY